MCRVNPPCGSRTNVQRSVLPPNLNSSIQGQLQGGASQTLYAVLFRLAQAFLAADQSCSSQSIHIYMAHSLYSSHTLSALVTLFPFSCICSPLHLLRLHTPSSWKNKQAVTQHHIHFLALAFSGQAGGPRQEPHQVGTCLAWVLGTDTKEGPRTAVVTRNYHFRETILLLAGVWNKLVVSYIGPSL